MSSSPSHDTICLPITFINELSQSNDLHETLTLISNWLPQIIGSDRASVCLNNGSDETLEVFALFGNNAIEANTILPISSTMVGRVYSNKQLEINNNLAQSKDLDCQILHKGGLGSCVDAPLQHSGTCFGTLNLGSLEPDTYKPEDGAQLECIANWLANYIHAQMEITEHKKRAETDPLTKANNRHCLNTVGNELLKLWETDQQPFSMIMIDIDHFKQFNDNYGHHVGDQILVTFSQVINQVIRKSEHFMRIGGDEFVILLEGNVDLATKLAERIRKAIKDMALKHDDDSLIITVSCGVTSVQNQDSSLECLYNRADKALYQSKKNGRDQTTAI
ncbi:sensor domain-containing diguanylate cyclase [Pseudoalteromonas umbrosa]|uniref:sensor domain-containing diguanylate cyclase n=1 Tax=Pseudoalteromonas umbrosa TaxID=3048489 RepID=UPI0024C3FF25|nr:sensor domain-containing diguanylate cyclase [Pseudoalteromonas sp. B95]MDK1286321.1 sensor domain-containing diguanylate cyclase [Pseudoalteromonas sp. B95]